MRDNKMREVEKRKRELEQRKSSSRSFFGNLNIKGGISAAKQIYSQVPTSFIPTTQVDMYGGGGQTYGGGQVYGQPGYQPVQQQVVHHHHYGQNNRPPVVSEGGCCTLI